jgi:hypothetical protein
MSFTLKVLVVVLPSVRVLVLKDPPAWLKAESGDWSDAPYSLPLQGKAVQIDSFKPTLKASGAKRLKL